MRWLALLFLASPLAADPGTNLATAAATQVGVTTIYDPAYVGLAFPGGDLPRERGVCTDVVIRALRDAWGIDLQAATNADMRADFAAYPKLWGLSTTDRNIDHRRVPNLETLLTRASAALPLSSDPTTFAPGDIVSFRLTGSNLPHIGIIANQTAPDGTPLVTHNIGAGTRSENILFAHPMTAHFRLTEAARQWLATR